MVQALLIGQKAKIPLADDLSGAHDGEQHGAIPSLALRPIDEAYKSRKRDGKKKPRLDGQDLY